MLVRQTRLEATRILLAARSVRRPLPGQEAGLGLPEPRWIDAGARGRFAVRDLPADGPTLVLLHPWTWTSDVAFGQLLAPLSRRHRIVTYDQRGHGRGPPVGQRPVLDDFVDDLFALLDALAVRRPVLVGHSLGGLVAMRAAVRAPERLAGIVVSGASASYTALPRDRWVWRLLRAAGSLARAGLGVGLPLRYFQVSAHRHPELWRRWEWLESELAHGHPYQLWKIGRMVAELDLREQLRRPLGCPVAYIRCMRDTICDPRLQSETARLLAAPAVDLDLDHDAPVTHPGAYADALARALRLLEP